MEEDSFAEDETNFRKLQWQEMKRKEQTTTTTSSIFPFLGKIFNWEEMVNTRKRIDQDHWILQEFEHFNNDTKITHLDFGAQLVSNNETKESKVRRVLKRCWSNQSIDFKQKTKKYKNSVT